MNELIVIDSIRRLDMALRTAVDLTVFSRFLLITACAGALSACSAQEVGSAEVFSMDPRDASRKLAEYEARFRAGEEAKEEYSQRLASMIDEGLEIVRSSPSPDRFQILSGICSRAIDMGFDASAKCTEVYRQALETRDIDVMLRTPALLLRLRGAEALSWMFNFVVYENGPLAREVLTELGARRAAGDLNEAELEYLEKNAHRLCDDQRITESLRTQCRSELLSDNQV